MLTELKLSNFRVFDDEVTVRFRPITVFIGRNSSGKSTIIKFLLMLQQSAAPGQSQFLNPEGDKVNLGVFSELKNALTRKRNLRFSLTARSTSEDIDRPMLRYVGLTEGDEEQTLLYRTRASISYGSNVAVDSAGHFLLDELTGRTLMRSDAKASDEPTFLASPPSGSTEFGLVEPGEERLTRSEAMERMGKALIQELTSPRSTMNRFNAELALVRNLRREIHSIQHLSPVREESQRVILASLPPVNNVGQRGQYALPHLQKVVSEHKDGYKFISRHILSVTGISGITFKTSSGYVSRALARNETTGADVLIADYGFGVGQCLPILVQGAIMAPRTTLMVEQPEAQLHPMAQLELGSFFADLWTQRQVGSIIETHSDNILLRLRRLIARGELSHEDVSVAFFTIDGDSNMPTVKNLDINEDGTMQPGLPMEFFGADIMEGLQLGARA